MKKYYLDLFKAWLHEYFKHPIPNIRTARPIIPGKLYDNFGNICKAVPMTDVEKAAVSRDKHVDTGNGVYLMQQVKMLHGNLDAIKKLQIAASQAAVPVKCTLCDFYDRVPCPIFNTLADKTTVCDTYKYKIIRYAKD